MLFIFCVLSLNSFLTEEGIIPKRFLNATLNVRELAYPINCETWKISTFFDKYFKNNAISLFDNITLNNSYPYDYQIKLTLRKKCEQSFT